MWKTKFAYLSIYFWIHCWDILCESQHDLILYFLHSNIRFGWKSPRKRFSILLLALKCCNTADQSCLEVQQWIVGSIWMKLVNIEGFIQKLFEHKVDWKLAEAYIIAYLSCFLSTICFCLFADVDFKMNYMHWIIIDSPRAAWHVFHAEHQQPWGSDEEEKAAEAGEEAAAVLEQGLLHFCFVFVVVVIVVVVPVVFILFQNIDLFRTELLTLVELWKSMARLSEKRWVCRTTLLSS